LHSHLTVTNNTGYTQSLWMEVELPIFESLTQHLNVDVCIVGGGIVGLTCAYTLAKKGKSVAVLDRGTIAGGETARTTAHLTWMLDDRFFDLEKLFGEEKTRLAAQSHAAAIDYIEQIIHEEDIDCDFERVDGYLFVPPHTSQEVLDNEFTTLQKIGMPIERFSRAPFSSTFDTGPCLKVKRQAQFHILKYIKGLIKAIQKYQGLIFTQTHVNHVEGGNICLVKTDSESVVSSHSVIIATCTPINHRFFIHTKQAAYRTYVITASVPKKSVPKGLYWDTSDPYHYIRIQKNHHSSEEDILIIGGEDHKTGQYFDMEKRYAHLEKWARLRFPMIKQIISHWSGQVYEPIDSLAFIGRDPKDKNIYIATGDSGNGMTHGTIAGILLPDLIHKKQNPWEDLYDPQRKTLLAITEFVHENANAVSQYRDWLLPGEKKKIEALKPENGLILRRGVKKIAIYKDIYNQIHIHSAFCPHLGGCLRWNKGEKTWDCPVHGSRFDGRGSAICGPAISHLSSEE